MNLRILNFFFASLLLASSIMHAQGNLTNQGASIVCNGSIQLVLQNTGFTNNGTFTAGNSIVTLKGGAASPASFVDGTTAPAFYSLTIDKPANDALLKTNININGNVTLNNGNLQLNGYTIDLGNASGTIINEAETHRIKGNTGGSIIKTIDLNAPASVNPGNIGIEISSPVNLGQTIITRRHTLSTSASGGIGIYRYFDINAVTSSAVSASLKMYYFDGELGSIPEGELVIWNSADAGINWVALGSNSKDASADFLTQTSINELNRRFTLGSTTTTPLPLTLLDFNGKYICKNAVQLSWTTTSEISTDHFEIERSGTGVAFSKRGIVKAKGNNGSEVNYSYIDTVSTQGALFYRLKMVDKNLQYTYSKTILLNQDGDQENSIKIYPNPVEENFTALFHTKASGQYTLNLYSDLGRLVDSKSVTAVKGDNFIYWNMLHLASGNYLLKAENTRIPGTVIIKK